MLRLKFLIMNIFIISGLAFAVAIPKSLNKSQSSEPNGDVVSTNRSKIVAGLYKANDQSLLQINRVTNTSFVLAQAYSEYAPECSMVKSLTFKQVAPNLFVWNKDKCQMIITKVADSNSMILTVNKLDKCFAQYDADQPFMCFGNPMTEAQGNYIAGRVYKLDTNPNDNINY